MSTLGTFSEYADFNFLDKLGKGFKRVKNKVTKAGAEGNKRVKSVVNSARRAVEPGFKDKENLARSIKTRNIIVGGGLAGLGAGTAGAIALNGRQKKRTEMSSASGYSLFAKKTYGEVTDAMRVGGADLNDADKAKVKAIKDGKNKLDANQLKGVQDRAGKYKAQRALEKASDTGKGMPKAGVVSRTAAIAGSPERSLISSGKASSNKFLKGAAEGAEKFGKAGYQTGASGARGFLNKAVGRTVTGKAARLGVAGAGIAAIGGALRKKRNEQY